MKKLFTFLMFISFSLILLACDSTQSYDETFSNEKDISTSLSPSLSQKSEDYNLDLNYSDEYFKIDASIFSKKTALLSFGGCISTDNTQRMEAFFNQINFDDILFSNDYLITTQDSIGYTFAHKKIDDFDLVAVMVRGFNYGLEWVSNMKIGSNGNHQGFDESANKILDNLKLYLQKYQNKDIKIWISGYSRAGAVSNVFASNLLSENYISQENLFAYTFEAPKCLSKKNAKPYKNVHNIINSADLVTYIPPTEYDLYRCGVDIDIYKSNVLDLAASFDDEMRLPNFTKASNFNNPKEFIRFFINGLTTNSKSDDESLNLSNKQEYTNNYQDTFMYIANLAFSLKSSTIKNIIQTTLKMSMNEILNLSYGDNLYNFLKLNISQDGFDFNDIALKNHCSKVSGLISHNNNFLFGMIISYPSNLVYTLIMHFPEVNYFLLLNL